MKWIEMIGPSGVGKSYLFKMLHKSRKSPSLWLTPNEAFRIICVRENFGFIRRTLNPFLKIVFGRELNLFSQISQSYLINTIDTNGKYFNFLSEVIVRELALSNSTESRKKLQMISWYYENRLLPFIVLHSSNIGQTVLFDDGIIHNNRGMFSLNKYLSVLDTAEQTIFPDAVIFCTAEPELIYDRVRARNRSNKGTFLQRDLSDEQLWIKINSSIKGKLSVVNQLKSNGCQVLEIDTSNNIVKNCDIINSFIRNYKTLP